MLSLGLISLLIAVPLFSHRITPSLFTKITAIILIYSSLLVYNTISIEALESGVGIYSGMFHITTISIGIETFILFTGALVIIGWAPIMNNILSTEPHTDGNEQRAFLRRSYDQKAVNEGYFGSYTQGAKTPQFSEISEYSLIIIFTLIGGCLLISSSDFVSMYLSIELQSFGVYIIATLYRNSESATAAGLKYFLLGGLSSALILLGTALIYSYTGITQFESINSLLSVGGVFPSTDFIDSKANSFSDHGVFAYMIFGIILIGVGLLFKVAAAPFHNWAPDVYSGVPTIVTSWLTTMPKISIFVFIMELMVSNVSQGFEFISPQVIASLEGQAHVAIEEGFIIQRAFAATIKNILLVTALMSLIIGTVVGLTQHRIKRLLAYSTISHVGFILLALSINTQESIESFLFYIIQYSITNVNTFLVLLAFGYTIYNGVISVSEEKKNSSISTLGSNTNKGDSKNTSSEVNPHLQQSISQIKVIGDIHFISDIKGQFTNNPLLALSFSLCLFSMAGIPPMVGFFAKQIVLYSSVHAGYYFISIVAIVVSVISASYYLKIIGTIYFSSVDAGKNNDTHASQRKEINSVSNSEPYRYTKALYSINNKSYNVTNIHSMLIATITTVMTLFVLQPSILLNSCHLLALSMFYY